MQTRRKKVHPNAVGQASVQDGHLKSGDTDFAKTTEASPAKRKKTTPPPSKYKKVEIPHAATLPRIVWVFDAQNKWWPGKIAQYPPEDNRATVVRFGAIEPKAITVDCSESNILPFGQTPENPSEPEITLTEDLDAALKEANEAQVHDDDDLPSMDDILSHFSSSTPSPSMAKKVGTGNQRKLPKSNTAYSPDISLTIPGELVLALSDRFYYPGRVMTFNNKTNKYKVDYASGHSISIERKKFFTRYEKGFQTCSLGELALPTIKDDYEDKELESQVRDLYPALYAIIAGTHDESGRLRAFTQGGKARRSLAQRVGPGSFNRAEYALINNLLQSEFLPDLVTTKMAKVGTYPASASEILDPPMKRDGDITRDFSDQMRLHFVTDVLLPETITRLTMQRNIIPYAEAEQRVMECKRDDSTDTWWVDDVLAARESFLDGRAR